MKTSLFEGSQMSPSLFTLKEQYLQSHNKRGRSYSLCYLSKKQQKTLTCNNKHLSYGMTYTLQHGIPEVAPYNGPIKFSPCRFDQRGKTEARNTAIHFFMHDYLFYTAVSTNLELTTYKLSKFDYLFAPDCSLYVDASKQENLHAIYISRFAAAYWQKCGFNVIPVASWGDANSLSYCFEGLPSNSVIAVCGIGHEHCSAAKKLWLYAVNKLIDNLSPTTLIVFGGNEEDTRDLPANIVYYPDYIHKKFRANGKKKQTVA